MKLIWFAALILLFPKFSQASEFSCSDDSSYHHLVRITTLYDTVLTVVLYKRDASVTYLQQIQQAPPKR